MTQPKPNTMDDWIDEMLLNLEKGFVQIVQPVFDGFKDGAINKPEAKALITAKLKEVDRAARIDELERVYLVYGTKDKPASLDNIFSLGKKGEVAAMPIKDRLASLKGGDV